jgi:hypothetical protein
MLRLYVKGIFLHNIVVTVIHVSVEMLNLRLRKKQQPKPVKLYKPILNWWLSVRYRSL